MLKRVFDIISSVIVLVLLSPLFIAISINILIDSRGGIFYKQIRVGKNKNEFKLMKFRTMQSGSDKKGLITVGESDSRITKIGRVLRKYKLDEFPQLLNVIKGEMSIVGPRPEVPKYVSMYSEEQLKVLSVRPGLTDLASIEFINENEMRTLSIFPNPATHQLNLEVEEPISTLVITDVSGKKVFSSNKIMNKQIDVSNLKKGIYFITIQTNSYSAISKFIKD